MGEWADDAFNRMFDERDEGYGEFDGPLFDRRPAARCYGCGAELVFSFSPRGQYVPHHVGKPNCQTSATDKDFPPV